MAYAYKIKAYGIKLDFDSCPPELGYKVFPRGDWRAASVDPVEKCYEFIFDEKQAILFKNDFIEITETDL